VRTTLVAVIVVGLALTGGAIALVTVLHESLTAQVKASAQLRASELAAQFVSTGLPPNLADVIDKEQIITNDGKVISNSLPILHNQEPWIHMAPGQSFELNDTYGRLLVVAIAAGSSHTVVVTRSLDAVDKPIGELTTALWWGIPGLLLIVGLTTWFAVRRALAPVDGIRREVEEISATQLHRRVPDPSGRDEIARLARTMNQMLGRLEQSVVRQRRFISDASHELRSPVATVRQHAEVALAYPKAMKLNELAETVLTENRRMERLVSDLLLLAKSDEATLLAAPQQVDLDDLVIAEASRLRKTTSLQIDTTWVSAGRVIGDTTALGRVLRNLADNAARHAESRISFAMWEHGGWVTVVVGDDGQGIPAPARNLIFDRFVRLDSARARDSGGSGLGLAIVADVVMAHGGWGMVDESPLGGAQFWILLPAEQGGGTQ
jgi:signal transduction histidine kinase